MLKVFRNHVSEVSTTKKDIPYSKTGAQPINLKIALSFQNKLKPWHRPNSLITYSHSLSHGQTAFGGNHLTHMYNEWGFKIPGTTESSRFKSSSEASGDRTQ